MTDTCHIQGSWGTFSVDMQKGTILSRTREGNPEQRGYDYITRFDRETLTGSHLDILECGYWEEVDGVEEYVAPDEDFINECRRPPQ